MGAALSPFPTLGLWRTFGHCECRSPGLLMVGAAVGPGKGNSQQRTVSNGWATSTGNTILLDYELTPALSAFEANEEALED